MSRPRIGSAPLAFLACALLSGCGPAQSEVSGTVTFQRGPVTSGSVILYCQDKQILTGAIGADGCVPHRQRASRPGDRHGADASAGAAGLLPQARPAAVDGRRPDPADDDRDDQHAPQSQADADPRALWASGRVGTDACRARRRPCSTSTCNRNFGKLEIRISKSETNSKFEIRKNSETRWRSVGFVLRISDLFRISIFGFRAFLTRVADATAILQQPSMAHRRQCGSGRRMPGGPDSSARPSGRLGQPPPHPSDLCPHASGTAVGLLAWGLGLFAVVRDWRRIALGCTFLIAAALLARYRAACTGFGVGRAVASFNRPSPEPGNRGGADVRPVPAAGGVRLCSS